MTDEAHALEGLMIVCTMDEIHSALMWEPPTMEQLVTLGLEELAASPYDRAGVYRLLEMHKPENR